MKFLVARKRSTNRKENRIALHVLLKMTALSMRDTMRASDVSARLRSFTNDSHFDILRLYLFSFMRFNRKVRSLSFATCKVESHDFSQLQFKVLTATHCILYCLYLLLPEAIAY